MKDGVNNMHRKKDTRLQIEYRARLVHNLDHTVSYMLLLSYKADSDEYPISFYTRRQCDPSGKTYKLASDVSKAFEKTILPDYTWMDEIIEEGWFGNVLDLITFKKRSAFLKAIQEIQKIADIYGHTLVNEYHTNSVSCGITPKKLDTGKSGYEISLSYSGRNDVQPFSNTSNSKFVNEATMDFAEFFTSELYDTEYKDFISNREVSDRYALFTIDCEEENLTYELSKLKKTAIALGCKLHFIAFPGGPGWQYPDFNLRKYVVE